MSRFSLRLKLFGSFAAVLVVMLFVSMLSYNALGSLGQATVDMRRTSSINAELDRFISAMYEGQSGAFEYLLTGDNQERQRFVESRATAIGHLDEVGGLTQIAAVQEYVQRSRPLVATHYETLEQAVGARDAFGAEAAIQLLSEIDVNAAMTQIESEYRELMETRDELMALRQVNAVAEVDSGRQQIIAGSATAALLVAALAWLISRHIGSSVARSARELDVASDELASVSAQVGAAAQETSTQVSTVASASEEVSANVQTVASAVEELSASIRGIASSSTEAREVASSAVGTAQETNRKVEQLGASSAEIGHVIQVITTIAEQTNLLALNATIEAARAGEAGRGFAVVANEVKELAQQTATATEEIRSKITAIQGDSAEAVSAIGEIGEVIEKVAEMQTTIASAVEEQTATTSEITRTLAEAAAGSAQIADNIFSVATAADETAQGASTTQQAAGQLRAVAAGLQALVDGASTSSSPAEPVPATTAVEPV